MDEHQLKQIIDQTFHFLNNKGVSFICCIWDKEGNHGGGCNSADADVGDALITIDKIVKHFNINPDALFNALMETKVKQQEN